MIRSRLDRLERALLGATRDVCGACGGPISGFNMMIYLNEDDEPRWGQCSECGLALDKHGKPFAGWRLRPGEQPWTKVYGAGTPEI